VTTPDPATTLGERIGEGLMLEILRRPEIGQEALSAAVVVCIDALVARGADPLAVARGARLAVGLLPGPNPLNVQRL
jgi:hypothetical protein